MITMFLGERFFLLREEITLRLFCTAPQPTDGYWISDFRFTILDLFFILI